LDVDDGATIAVSGCLLAAPSSMRGGPAEPSAVITALPPGDVPTGSIEELDASFGLAAGTLGGDVLDGALGVADNGGDAGRELDKVDGAALTVAFGDEVVTAG